MFNIFSWIIGWFIKPKKPIIHIPNVRLIYKDGKTWVRVTEGFTINGLYVPAEYESDATSIPSFAQTLIGGRFDLEYLASSLGHDLLYDQIQGNETTNLPNINTYSKADKWFNQTLRLQSRKVKALLMYFGVRIYSTFKEQ